VERVEVTDLLDEDFSTRWIGVGLPDRFKITPSLNQVFVGGPTDHFRESRIAARDALSRACIEWAWKPVTPQNPLGESV
jgi:hypothetical protein